MFSNWRPTSKQQTYQSQQVYTTHFSGASRALKSLNPKTTTYDTDLVLRPTQLAACVDCGCMLFIHSCATTVTGRCTMSCIKKSKDIFKMPRQPRMMLIVHKPTDNESKSNLDSIKDEL